MERKKIWEANQGNPASQICSCGIKIGIKTREQKCTSHFTSLLRVGGRGWGWAGRGKICHSMLPQIFSSLCLVQWLQGEMMCDGDGGVGGFQGALGACGGRIRLQGELKREHKSTLKNKGRKMPHETISTLRCVPPQAHHNEQRGIDS